jgi:hypothetical protein
MHLKAHTVGLALGTFAGVVHFVWSIIVGMGWGQVVFDFVLSLHMIHSTTTVGPFDFGTAITLIVITAIVGYIVGNVFATIWNRIV